MQSTQSDHEPPNEGGNATIELFIHSAGDEHPSIIEVTKTAPVRILAGQGEADIHIWMEGADEAIDTDLTFDVVGISHHQHVHKSHCQRVKVTVRWGGSDYTHPYSPATTIATIEKWAFDEVAHFSPEQAAQHVLMEPGADHFLAGGVHVGSLVKPDSCAVTLDLLPRSRFAG